VRTFNTSCQTGQTLADESEFSCSHRTLESRGVPHEIHLGTRYAIPVHSKSLMVTSRLLQIFEPRHESNPDAFLVRNTQAHKHARARVCNWTGRQKGKLVSSHVFFLVLFICFLLPLFFLFLGISLVFLMSLISTGIL